MITADKREGKTLKRFESLFNRGKEVLLNYSRKRTNMRKEYLNYKDKIILEQNGRWYNLYVDGSLIHANMNREGAIKVYFSYVKD